MTIDDWRARYDGLNAEADRIRAEVTDLRKRLDVALFLVDALRAQVTPEVVSEKHKDGKWRLVWEENIGEWCKAQWHAIFSQWEFEGYVSAERTPTHALPLPPAPEVKNEGE